MPLFDKTVYPQLPSAISADELALHFTLTEDEIEFINKNARRKSSRLSLAVLLKPFQHLHRFSDPSEVPAAVVDHLRIHLRLGPAVPFGLSDPLQRARHRNSIREYTGVMAWSTQARHLAATTGLKPLSLWLDRPISPTPSSPNLLMPASSYRHSPLYSASPSTLGTELIERFAAPYFTA